MKFRTQYDDDHEEVSLDTSLSMTDPETGEVDVGKTQQEFAAEADINTIVERFGLTGAVPEVWNAPQSGDFTGVSDFSSAMQAVRKAEEAFMELPGDVRARFANDPQRLMEFLENDKNRDEAMKLGLLRPVEKPVRDVVTAVDDLAKAMTSIPKPS